MRVGNERRTKYCSLVCQLHEERQVVGLFGFLDDVQAFQIVGIDLVRFAFRFQGSWNYTGGHAGAHQEPNYSQEVTSSEV